MVLRGSGLALLLSLKWLVLPIRASGVTCTQNRECESILREGSECVDGFCTNPFHSRGCLGSLLPGWHKIRVCSSDDPPEAEEMGYCRQSPLDHMEIRVLGQDWESSFFGTWILQILLSEILDVPVSVETASPGLNTDFYNIQSSLDYGSASADFSEVIKGNDVGDCRLVRSDQEEGYQACAHVVPEVWAQSRLTAAGRVEGTERLRELGALGELHLFVPRFTAERDSSVLTYLGLQGEDNRSKLASMFKRPTTWRHYCSKVSENGCATPDEVAIRPPADEGEEESMFVEGVYTGHFRATLNSKCDVNPECTGHIADFPCHWASFIPQQMHHLDIALESDGPAEGNSYYTYSQLTQIWAAANATKSDVMMLWWYPEALYETYIGTDAEFTRVVLPPPTQKCVDARLAPGARCGDDLEAAIGEPEGVCDYQAQGLKKMVAESLYELTSSKDIPEALWSPAYDAIKNYQMTSLQLGQIFGYWLERGTDTSNYDPREATCRWVVENLELIQSFVPPTYPRVVEEEIVSGNVLFIAALVVAALATLLPLAAICMTYLQRKTKVMYYAQPEFLYLLLVGALLVAMGAVLLAVPPTDATCISIVWLVNLGFALQLVPLVLRISAINGLLGEGKVMQRVRLGRKRLLSHALLGVLVIGGFLVAWTVFDAPEKELQYVIQEETTDFGETIVTASDHCSSESEVWRLLSYCWQALLLLPGAVVALIAGRVREDLNDTGTISIVIFTHFFFLMFRVSVVSLGNEFSDVMGYLSLILSGETIISIVVYVLPKFMNSGEVVESEPLPDLFVHTTIMVADVSSFTEWSSVREPVQVFKFLELLYESFDRVATRHKVYKVETVREHYVAATGIPEAQPDHAVLMARFASDIVKKMTLLCKKFEVLYGPDTGDLTLRVGLHSGPVTGGFTKGKGARFQLFGDTMTTTSLIHQHGKTGRIHISEKTAGLLVEAGKQAWIQEREGMIQTHAKGELQTWWLARSRQHRGSVEHETASHIGSTLNGSNDLGADEVLAMPEISFDSEKRWVDFNVETLKNLLKPIVARRENGRPEMFSKFRSEKCFKSVEKNEHGMPLEEVREIIELPAFDKRAAKRQRDHQSVEISEEVVSQLTDYVTLISSMYNKNPFHNFAHASYVVMAIQKYINRILAASEIDLDDLDRGSRQEALHDHTYGLTSDPLTHFACVFSALIHDVDHPGVPNLQLIKEDDRVASVYKKRSVAEQKSFDLAWDLLMESSFDQLRETMCDSEAELGRFRQLVVNSVMATDLGDKELKELRNRRWDRAFHDDKSSAIGEDPRDSRNRKATIVIEHLIQAADVAHTCQHWMIYRKWNERLFHECYNSYLTGRAEKNPANTWYDGELGFFDFYIIPLSEKLRDCGVFGPTSDENLNYATNNRAMWEKEGREIVAEMLRKYEVGQIEKVECSIEFA